MSYPTASICGCLKYPAYSPIMDGINKRSKLAHGPDASTALCQEMNHGHGKTGEELPTLKLGTVEVEHNYSIHWTLIT